MSCAIESPAYHQSKSHGQRPSSREAEGAAERDHREASPTLTSGIVDAIMDAMDAHSEMSRQALNSEKVRDGIKEILLNYAGLWEALRSRAERAELN